MIMNFGSSYNDVGSGVAQTVVDATAENISGTGTTETAKSTTGVIGLLTLLIAFFVWNFIDDNESIREQVKPENIKANIRNMLIIGLGAVLFINIYNIAVGKMLVAKSSFINAIGRTLKPLAIGLNADE